MALGLVCTQKSEGTATRVQAGPPGTRLLSVMEGGDLECVISARATYGSNTATLSYLTVEGLGSTVPLAWGGRSATVPPVLARGHEEATQSKSSRAVSQQRLQDAEARPEEGVGPSDHGP
jgi:hypothetical protein